METIIIQLDDKKQAETIKAFLKAINADFETRKSGTPLLKKELKEAFREVKLIKEGKGKSRPIEDLLDEL